MAKRSTERLFAMKSQKKAVMGFATQVAKEPLIAKKRQRWQVLPNYF